VLLLGGPHVVPQGGKLLLLLLSLRRLLQRMMMQQLLRFKPRWLHTGQALELGGVPEVRLLWQSLLQLSQQQQVQADASAGQRAEEQRRVLALLPVAAESWC
jgi:hypothetical protein